MKQIKDKAEEMMNEIDTREMNTNIFVYQFLERYMKGHYFFKDKFKYGPSLESIVRARRYVISKNQEKYGRTNKTSEIEYIEEYGNECTPSNS